MALLGEEVVEEWLNRKGYFTIRGIKLGVHEIDILAFKPDLKGQHDCRHIEVQISTNPISYISKVPKKIQKEKGIGPDNAKDRSVEELRLGVAEWIKKKYDHPKKIELRNNLFSGVWSKELVVNEVKYPDELQLFKEQGVSILLLKDIVHEMATSKHIVTSAAGGDLLTLMQLGLTSADGPESAIIG